jgi:hypothetical protein
MIGTGIVAARRQPPSFRERQKQPKPIWPSSLGASEDGGHISPKREVFLSFILGQLV